MRKGLREEAGRAIVRGAPVHAAWTIWHAASRELRKDEMKRLAEIGALNALDQLHRRDALWQAQRAVLPVGPLLEPLEETGVPSPLAAMNTEERLWADYRGHRADGRQTSDGAPPRGDERARREARRRTGARSRRPHRAHRRLGDRAAASGDGERFRVPQHGRRDRHHERDRHAPALSTATSSKCWASRS